MVPVANRTRFSRPWKTSLPDGRDYERRHLDDKTVVAGTYC